MRTVFLKNIVRTTLLNACLVLASPAVSEQLLVSPDAQLRGMLFDHLNGAVPNFNDIARQSQLVREATEFTRATVLQTEINRLQELWSGLSDVDALQFNVTVYFGEYNGSAMGFPISLFAPGTYIQGAVPVTFSNASEMSIYPVSADQGPATLDLLDNSRTAIAKVTLRSLRASPTRSGAIEGQISEVVFANRAGTEIGRYSAAPADGPDAEGDLAPAAAGISLTNSLGVPPAGTSWEDVLPFLESQGFVSGEGQNFSGQLFKIEDGKLSTQKPLERYDELMLGFGTTEQTALLARKEVSRMSFGFDAPKRPFGTLNCGTANVSDACGVMKFKRRNGEVILVDMMLLVELSSTPYQSPLSAFPFDNGILSRMRSADTQVSYAESELGGAQNRGAGAKVLWSGDLLQKAAPMHDLRDGYADTFSADVMLWLIDNQKNGTLVVVRSSEPQTE